MPESLKMVPSLTFWPCQKCSSQNFASHTETVRKSPAGYDFYWWQQIELQNFMLAEEAQWEQEERSKYWTSEESLHGLENIWIFLFHIEGFRSIKHYKQHCDLAPAKHKEVAMLLVID